MAFVWIQQWVALPVIVEEPMGDVPAETGLQPGPSRAGYSQEEGQAPGKPFGNVTSPPQLDTRIDTSAPFCSQYSSLSSSQQRMNAIRSPAQQTPTSYNIPHGQDPGSASFNMGAMAGAVPDYSANPQTPAMAQYSQPQTQRGLSGASTPALVYQLQQISQYPGQTAAAYAGQSPVAPSFAQGQYGNVFMSPMSATGAQSFPFSPSPQRQSVQASVQPQYGNYQQQNPQYMYYPGPYGSQGLQSSQMQQQYGYGRRASLDTPISGGAILSGSRFGAPSDYGFAREGSESSLSSVLRGPPRKPKQSGHALWVGNIPPGTTVLDLKDHFSRDATKDIESLFLISKSNCAFVNYRSEASCSEAMRRFHDSRFNGVRLVCRLRRSSAAASGIPTGPSAMTVPRPPSMSPERAIAAAVPVEDSPGKLQEQTDQPGAMLDDATSSERPKVAEKFFVVKSLTLQDMKGSVRSGIWATQSHNEETLNQAYESAEDVYLIFSANKSGEYFGYARMASAISADASQVMSSVPRPAEVTEPSDGPKSIPTPATEHAPKGRIIDDSARGTIFWEADHSDEEEEALKEGAVQASDSEGGPSQTWGKPFKVEWISTNRLPFYRTRGLRNSWNANREIKIARDGTELETSVGKRLVQMFHRLGPSSMSVAPPSAPAFAQY